MTQLQLRHLSRRLMRYELRHTTLKHMCTFTAPMERAPFQSTSQSGAVSSEHYHTFHYLLASPVHTLILVPLNSEKNRRYQVFTVASNHLLVCSIIIRNHVYQIMEALVTHVIEWESHISCGVYLFPMFRPLCCRVT